MISLKNVHKYFNKNRSNQIHVINNTSIDFPKTGLVALTGPSGCGKTTLLNVIGGLDSFYSGEIIVDNTEIKKYSPMTWDVLRNEKIGYIFQNYNLVLSKTVYENVELALNMAGIYEKSQVEERIKYVLESVGMYNYRRRNVKALSGGQQQRVAIARALAKDPDVVLADEPTGNLDANNTFEIMSIIKKISETRLVILVTHEKGLVEFYADRIIELVDGTVVKDYENAGGSGFEHIDERNIYLKDLSYDDSLKEKGIEHYYENEKDESLKIKLIELKGNLYVKVDSKRKIKYLDKDSEIRLLDEHYRKREASDIESYDFDLSQFGKQDHKSIRKSFIRWRTALRNGFKRLFVRRKFGSKLLLLGYVVVTALMVFQLASFGGLTRIDEREFLRSPKEMLKLEVDESFEASDLQELLENVEGIEYSPYETTTNIQVSTSDFYQGKANIGVRVYPVKLSEYQDVELFDGGRLPETINEVVISEWIAEDILEAKAFKDLGIKEISELLGITVSKGNFYFYDEYYDYYSSVSMADFEIVGVAKSQSPIMIVDDEALYGFVNYFDSRIFPYELIKDEITITEGRTIASSGETIVHESMKEFYPLNENIGISGSGILEVVGYFDYSGDETKGTELILATNSFLEEYTIRELEQNLYYGVGVLFYVDDPEQAIADAEELGYTLYNSYEADRDNYIENLRFMNGARISQAVFMIIGIVVYIYFMMRSSTLNRIKEIGVYRAIGATKRDIYKIFFTEILAFSLITILPGYLLVSYFVYQIQTKLIEFQLGFYLTLPLFAVGLVGLFVVNIVFGMLPIFNLLRKTPAQILAKYDI